MRDGREPVEEHRDGWARCGRAQLGQRRVVAWRPDKQHRSEQGRRSSPSPPTWASRSPCADRRPRRRPSGARQSAQHSRSSTPAIRRWFFPSTGSVPAGWTNENVGPTVVLLMVAFLVFYRRKGIAIPKWSVTGTVAALVGAAMLVGSPGNYATLSEIGATAARPTVPVLLDRFATVTHAIFLDNLFGLATLFVVLVVIVLDRQEGRPRCDRGRIDVPRRRVRRHLRDGALTVLPAACLDRDSRVRHHGGGSGVLGAGLRERPRAAARGRGGDRGRGHVRGEVRLRVLGGPAGDLAGSGASASPTSSRRRPKATSTWSYLPSRRSPPTTAATVSRTWTPGRRVAQRGHGPLLRAELHSGGRRDWRARCSLIVLGTAASTSGWSPT